MELEKMTEEQLLESIESIENEKERLESNLSEYTEALHTLRKINYVGKFFRYVDMGYTTYMLVRSEAEGSFSSGYMEVFKVEFNHSSKDNSITAAFLHTAAMEYLNLEWIEITREEFIEARDRAISFITSQVT